MLCPSFRLSQSVPAAWSSLTALQALLLNNNLLTGVLPASWQSLQQLTLLDLSGNVGFLSTVPAVWQSGTPHMASLLRLRLSGNSNM